MHVGTRKGTTHENLAHFPGFVGPSKCSLRAVWDLVSGFMLAARWAVMVSLQ